MIHAHGATAHASTTPSAEHDNRWWVVAATAGPLLLLMADNFGIAVVLPAMGDDLGAGPTESTWFYSAFLLSFAATQLPLGRLADLWGRRRLMVIGVIVFGASSALCGLAPNAAVAIGARAGEGLGAAMIYATTLSLVSNAFPAETRGTGIGVWTAIGLIGGGLGPFLGGVLIEVASWRWFFWINLPLCVVAIVLTYLHVPESRDETASGRIDWAGFGALFVGLLLSVYALNEAVEAGFGATRVVVPLMVGLAVLAAFGAIERRVREPLVDLSLFKSRNYAGAGGVAMFGSWLFTVVTVLIAAFLQAPAVADESAFTTGAFFLVFTAPIVVLSLANGWVIRRFRMRWPMVAGSVAMAASFVILAGISVDDAVVICVAVLFVQGIGQGLAYNVSTTAAMSEIPEQKAGVASGMIAVLRLLGMVIGLALSVTVQTTVGSGATGRSAPGVIDGMLSVAIFSFVVAAASAAFALLYRDRSGVASPP